MSAPAARSAAAVRRTMIAGLYRNMSALTRIESPTESLEFGLALDVAVAYYRVGPVLESVMFDTDFQRGHPMSIRPTKSNLSNTSICVCVGRKPAAVRTRRVRVS